MKVKEFEQIKGYWNGMVYRGNTVFKNNKPYVIDDPENLLQITAKSTTSFIDICYI